MITRKKIDTNDDDSYVLEGEEMWAQRVIDESQCSDDSSRNQEDTSSKDGE